MIIKKKFKINDFLLNVKLKKNINNVFSFFLSNLEDTNIKQISTYLIAQKNLILINFVKYIINISIKSSNIFMHISDSLGNQIKFYSIIFLLKVKKNKIKKTEIIKTFYNILLTKHYKILRNVKLELTINKDLNLLLLFSEKIKKKLFLLNIKFFNNIPYNGCRKKKKKK